MREVTILAVSDIVDASLYEHFDRDRWAQVDIVISCGDLPPSYLDFLCTTLGVPLLYVPGNHDSDYAIGAYDGLTNIDGRVWRGLGLTVVGFGGARWYNGRNLQHTEQAMKWRVWRATHRLPNIDIVVSHAPPMGWGDRDDPCHVGFSCYHRLIERSHPALFVHGHSHLYPPESRFETVGLTRRVNAYGHTLLTLSTSRSVTSNPSSCGASQRSVGGLV